MSEMTNEILQDYAKNPKINYYASNVQALARDLLAERKLTEQLRVQLAGCGVAALGGTNSSVVVKKGDYGWSATYQDVLELRLELDTAKQFYAEQVKKYAAEVPKMAERVFEVMCKKCAHNEGDYCFRQEFLPSDGPPFVAFTTCPLDGIKAIR